VNPLAFDILVASFTFPSFLPSRRLRDDEHDVRVLIDWEEDLRGSSWSWMFSRHSRPSASKQGTVCLLEGVVM
jgi:hypothetical protein